MGQSAEVLHESRTIKSLIAQCSEMRILPQVQKAAKAAPVYWTDAERSWLWRKISVPGFADDPKWPEVRKEGVAAKVLHQKWSVKYITTRGMQMLEALHEEERETQADKVERVFL